MKTITLQLYTFDELSEEVQKEIIERERWNIMDQCMEAYGSDYVTSLRTFEKLTNTQSCSWSVNYSGYNFNFKYNNNPIFECPIDCSNDIMQRNYVVNYYFDISIIILCHTLHKVDIIHLQANI